VTASVVVVRLNCSLSASSFGLASFVVFFCRDWRRHLIRVEAAGGLRLRPDKPHDHRHYFRARRGNGECGYGAVWGIVWVIGWQVYKRRLTFD